MIVDQHREFIDALLAGDDATLAETVERHIMRLRRPLR
jgi:DNA-binding GntR family transcriptional regulator